MSVKFRTLSFSGFQLRFILEVKLRMWDNWVLERHTQNMKEGNFGRIGYDRGISAEDKAKSALSIALSKKGVGIPDWLLGQEDVTKKEDAKKIDRWIITDVGKIKLQIKSSQVSANKFREEHPDIPVIVVRQGDDDHLIIDRIISAVGRQRKIYLLKRNQSKNKINKN